MTPGDIMIWHPVVMGDEHWRVRIVRALGSFFTVEPTAEGNPPGTRPGKYIARAEELHQPEDFTPTPGRFRSHMEIAFLKGQSR